MVAQEQTPECLIAQVEYDHWLKTGMEKLGDTCLANKDWACFAHISKMEVKFKADVDMFCSDIRIQYK